MFYPFWSGECCSKWQLQAQSQQRQRVFWILGSSPSFPSHWDNRKKKNSRILSWLWIRSSLDSACLEAPWALRLLRHDNRAFKYKACEKWQIRVGQIIHLLKDKHTVFARRTPKISLILQIIHKKISGINLDRNRFLQ